MGIFHKKLQRSIRSLFCLIGVGFISPSFALTHGHSPNFDLGEGVWHFELDDPEGAEAIDYDDGYWHRVSIPHTWNALDAQDGEKRASELRPAGYRLAVGWYRKWIDIPETHIKQRSFLRFEGASVVKQVYANGNFVGEHKGSFAAFCFEITDFVTPGEKALIAVRVDNTRRQGRDYTEEALDFSLKGLDIAPLRGDFNLYGGIYRGVELLTKPETCISPLLFASPGVFVTQPEVNAEQARLRVETVLSILGDPAAPAIIRARLVDAEGQLVAESEEPVDLLSETRPMLELIVENPRLWDGIRDPYRYTLEVTLQVAGQQSDTVRQKIGIRSLRYDEAEGFVLNGRPILLRGVNRHQDWEDRGWALRPRHHEMDFALIEEMGSNAVRLAHYPQDSYVLELCDRIGLITFIEIPLVGITHDSAAFEDNLKQQLQEMINQHYNRAGIPMWGLWNEVRPKPKFPDPIPLVEALNTLAHSEDPTRPTVAAADTQSGEAGLRDITDLLAWNLYPGWYGDEMPADMEDFILERLGRDDRTRIGISEYGAGASVYQHEDWSDLQKPQARHTWHPEEWQAHFH